MRFPVWVALIICSACTPKDDGSTTVEDVLALTGDATAGSDVYANDCAVCHGADGSGGSGSNLQGEDGLEDVISVVLSGEDAMPSFEGDLTAQEIADVAAYVTEGFPEAN